jgi:hypothetical protein
MARKPIELERAGMRTPRERVWSAIRKLRTFTLLQLQDSAYPLVSFYTARSYVGMLVKAGYLVAMPAEPAARGGTSQAHFELVKDSFDAPRLNRAGEVVTQGTATLAMWRAMIALKEFDWHDVARAASLPGAEVNPQTAKTYVVMLERAGYFRTVRASKPGIAARLRLVKNTGAHAPAITRRKTVFDRNLGEFIWQESAEEVCDGLE